MSSTRFRVGLALCLAVFVAVVPAGVAASAEDLQPVATVASADSTLPIAEGGNRWFVELKSAPTIKGSSEAKLNSEKQAFRAAAKEAGIEFRERFVFNRLWNGLSVEVADKKDVSTLSRLPDVKAVYPVLTVPAPRTETIDPDLATAINMTGAADAQEAGYTGDGVKVAVMDTGLDYDHADLGGDGVNRTDSSSFPTERVIAGHDFVGDAFNDDETSPAYNPTPSPDGRPDDCNGHGTHVSGIVGAKAAGDGGATGVAPDVRFGAYRVFGCAGSTSADIMIAAMERALADGMHVLNMSIGSAFNTWAQYPTAVASDALVDQGMIVVASIGNSGANGTWSAGAPGVGNNVIGVASFDNTHINALTFNTSPAETQMAYLQIANSTEAPTTGTSPEIVYIGRGCPQAGPSWTLDQEDPYLANPSGKYALIDRGICTFEGKYQRAIDAGAVGVVVANNSAGLFAGGGITDRGFPAVGISLADGNTLKSEIAAGPVTLTWTDTRINAPNPTGGIISTFSSFGTGAELAVKPDIGAPGGLIRSTYPLQSGGYAIVSGTSMSSPHVAGAVAQLLEAKPGTSPANVRALLQNSADPRTFSATSALLDNVHRQGAGMLDIDDSITAPVLVMPSKITLGEAADALTERLTLTNSTSTAITYDLDHQSALSTFGSTFAPSLTTSGVTAGGPVTFSPASTVLVPANGTETVDVTIPRPDFGALNKLLYGGWIRLTPQGGGQVLRVPYAGFGGDYQGFPVMNGLSQWNEAQSVAITGGPTGGTFTLSFTPPSGGAAETTTAIAYNATAAAVRAALAALPSIGGTANVATSGGPLPGAAVTVTFTGALGQRDIPEMTATSSLTGGTNPRVTVTTTRQGQASFPKLAKRVGFVAANNFTPTYTFPAGSPTYDLQKTNVFGRHVTDAPTVAVHLDHQVRSLTVTVLTAAGSPVTSDNANATVNAVAIVENYVPRNSTSGGFFAFEWDGRLARTLKNDRTGQWAVPDASYRLKVDIVKALANPGTAGHTETYTSPVFTIDRP